jgi:hypothetical protein
MYKKILLATFLIFPFLANAQSKPIVVKFVEKGIDEITNVIKINEHLNLFQCKINEHELLITAVNDKAEVLWRLPMQGYSLGSGLYKDKLLIITSPANTFGGLKLPFTGHLIDAETGKVQLEKEVFNGQVSHDIVVRSFFGENGAICKLSVRETRANKGIFMSSSKYGKTTSLTILDINEKLESINQFNPKIDENAFIGLTTNNYGDLFIASATNGYSVSIVRYMMGEQQPSAPINVEFDIKDKKDSDEPQKIIDNLKLSASEADRNNLYSCLIEKNANKEYQLTVNKVDFGKMNMQQSSEIFTKDHLNEILKQSVSVVKKYGASLGKPKTLTVDYLKEAENNLIVVFSNREAVTTYDGRRNSYYTNAGSLVINCYDLNIKSKFQTIMPIGYSAGGWFKPSYNHQNNSLFIVATDRTRLGGRYSGLTPLYGNLDLSNGNWRKLEYFDKSDLPGGCFHDFSMWYGECFISLISDFRTSGSSNITFYKTSY